jgi:hypothetical protein
MKGNIRFWLGIWAVLFSLTVPHPAVLVFVGIALIIWAFQARTRKIIFG